MSRLDEDIEGLKGRCEVVYRYVVPLFGSVDKDAVWQLYHKTKEAAEESLKELFMEEPILFVIHETNKNEAEFVVFVCTKYFNKHIGHLIKEQRDAEFTKVLYAIWGRLFDPTVEFMLRDDKTNS